MSTQEIAHDLVSLCKQGKLDEARDKYWSDDVLSVEAMGENAESHGKAAAKAKGEWWSTHHDVHGVEVEGPYVNGDDFTVRFIMDVTQKDKGRRIKMDEIALYHLKNGKIVEERFFYSA